MIQVLARAFRILEFVARDAETPHGLSAIAAHAGLNAPTRARILKKTLVRAGYVEQTAPKKGHVVGIGFPIRRGERVVAALGVFLPAYRFRGKHRQKILAGMKDASSSIGARLSSPPDADGERLGMDR